MLKNIIVITSLLFANIVCAQHVQWESDGLAHVNPPKYNPAAIDDDYGIPNIKERTISIRNLTMDFKKIDHIQIELINATPDLKESERWTEIVSVDVIAGFAKAHRASGMNHFYIEGNGPIVLDINVKAGSKTIASDLVIKVKNVNR